MTTKPAPPNIHDDDLVAEDDSIIGKAFKWSLATFVVIGIGVGLTVWALNRPAPQKQTRPDTFTPPAPFAAPAQAPPALFADITREAGIDFVHQTGAYGEKLLPETMGGGCAFLDFDNDGDQDLLLVNSTYWPGHAPTDVAPPTLALYRNDGKGRFENVTSGCGLGVSLYGMGAAVGDYDNDGWVDVYVTAVGPNRLFRNNQGKFEDVTARAGVSGDEEEWSTSAAFVDYDNDGRLDLFVCNYIRWSREIDLQVNYRLEGVGRAYGPPTNFQGAQPYLFQNRGDGTFTEVSAAAGLHVKNPATGLPVAKALGVLPIDLDRDGWIDLMVANDTTRKFLYRNKGDRTFEEKGQEYGLAYDRNGAATGAMGIDAAYYRDDDTLGFFIGNFANEMTSLYASQGRPTLFADEAIGEGIGSPTRLMLTFGVFLFDYDLDGRLDLLHANGHTEERINVTQSSQHYEQPAQLFWNCGPKSRGCFVPVPRDQMGDLQQPLVGRGAAYADIDGDGDLDVLLTQVGRAPVLLRNDLFTKDAETRGHKDAANWLRLKLVGTKSNRDAIGAWVEATMGERKQRVQVMPTRSYLSQVELPITLGLGNAQKLDSLRVIWPGGEVETLPTLQAGKQYTIQQGRGLLQ